MFITADEWIIRKIFQPISNWSMNRFHASNYWLAATTSSIYITTIIYEILFFNQNWIDIVFDALLALVILSLFLKNNKADKEYSVQADSTVANPERYNPLYRFIRISAVILWVVTLPITAVSMVSKPFLSELNVATIGFTMFMCTFYFMACDTNPPVPPKKKKSLIPVGDTT